MLGHKGKIKTQLYPCYVVILTQAREKNVLMAITNNQGAYLHAFPHHTHGMQSNKNKLEFCGSYEENAVALFDSRGDPRHHASIMLKTIPHQCTLSSFQAKKASS